MITLIAALRTGRDGRWGNCPRARRRGESRGACPGRPGRPSCGSQTDSSRPCSTSTHRGRRGTACPVPTPHHPPSRPCRLPERPRNPRGRSPHTTPTRCRASRETPRRSPGEYSLRSCSGAKTSYRSLATTDRTQTVMTGHPLLWRRFVRWPRSRPGPVRRLVERNPEADLDLRAGGARGSWQSSSPALCALTWRSRRSISVEVVITEITRIPDPELQQVSGSTPHTRRGSRPNWPDSSAEGGGPRGSWAGRKPGSPRPGSGAGSGWRAPVDRTRWLRRMNDSLRSWSASPKRILKPLGQSSPRIVKEGSRLHTRTPVSSAVTTVRAAGGGERGGSAPRS